MTQILITKMFPCLAKATSLSSAKCYLQVLGAGKDFEKGHFQAGTAQPLRLLFGDVKNVLMFF